jgi:hypothetical protein
MTAPRNTDRLIQEFLEEGRTELPDRAYDAVRAQIDHTRQRVFFGPWRFPQMQTYARYALGAGVVGLVALVGLQLFSLGGNVGKPSPPPTALVTPVPVTPPPTVAPTPQPTASPLTLTMGGLTALTKGHYVTDSRFLVPISFTVPPAWEGDVWSPYGMSLNRIGGPSLSVEMVSNVFKDPCHQEQGVLSPVPGRAPADLANAIAHMPGVTVTGPGDGTIAGLPAQELTLKVPDSLSGCNPDSAGNYRLWQDTDGGSSWGWPADSARIWITEADHQRLVISLIHNTRTQNGTFTDEVQSVLDSLVIGSQN